MPPPRVHERSTCIDTLDTDHFFQRHIRPYEFHTLFQRQLHPFVQWF